MNLVLRILSIVLLIIIALAAFTKFFILRGPRAQFDGELTLPQLTAPVQVYTDGYGVPHVYAINEEDLFFATGYIQASERLFQMDGMARAVEGRFAEVLGSEYIEMDKYLRIWGFYRVAQKIVAEMDPEYKRLLQRSIDGINAYIDSHRDDLPVEFFLAGYQPLRWSLEHMIGYSRLMAHDLNLAWMPELVFGAVLDKLGEDLARDLYPVYPDTKPYIVPKVPKGFSEAARPFLESETKIRQLTGAWGSHIGSNSWVLHGSRTVSGKPLLANDPHLGFRQPAVWYEMHLVGGRFDVAGATLAGIPLVVIGQNQSIAWGYTNVMTDDMDFYIEIINEEDPDRYYYDGGWRFMDLHTTAIMVKDGPPVPFTVRETIHGPIINDVHEVLKGRNHPPIAMSWVGNYTTTEVDAIFELNLATNWEEFSAAVAKFHVPGQNIVYADTAGNIGWRPATLIPKRFPGTGLVPLPGDDPRYDWQGFVPQDELPYLYNPASGFIATANNKTIDDSFPYYISAYWEPPSRANRIHEMLSWDRKYTASDMAVIQMDVLSDHARDLIPQILKYGRPAPVEFPEVILILDILEDWNFLNDDASIGATVFNTLFVKLTEEVYGDELEELGPGYTKGFLTLANVPIRNLQYLLELGETNWFDDRNTIQYTETPREIVIRALLNTSRELKETLGQNPRRWRWGRLHTLTHLHAMSDIKPVERFLGLDVGPFPAPGSGTTVNNMEFELFNPFKVVLGPSLRHIYDFSEFTTATRCVLPTGQSGNPASPHYDDQAVLYNSGSYRFFPIEKSVIKSLGYQKLIMLP